MDREIVKTKTMGIKIRTETLGAEENLTNHIFGLHPHPHPQHWPHTSPWSTSETKMGREKILVAQMGPEDQTVSQERRLATKKMCVPEATPRIGSIKGTLIKTQPTKKNHPTKFKSPLMLRRKETKPSTMEFFNLKRIPLASIHSNYFALTI